MAALPGGFEGLKTSAEVAAALWFPKPKWICVFLSRNAQELVWLS